jgi:hypothetical protein
MAVECYVGDPEDWGYGYQGPRMYEVAQTISGMTNIDIIDCYSAAASPTRYKGDPISNSVWTSGSDVDDENAWMVIECTTTRYPSLGLPNWQAKIQWCNTNGFDDVSGLDYDMEGYIRQIALRVAVYGGWDLADSNPDFSGPSGELSSKNKELVFTVGNGVYLRSIFIEDTGTLAWIARYGFTGTEETFLGMIIMGEFTAINETYQTMPRLFMTGKTAAMYGAVASNSWICEENTSTNYWSNTTLTTWSKTNLGIGYVNPSGVWTEEAFQTQPGGILVNSMSQPTLHTVTPEMDVLPYLICTYSSRIIGELPLVAKGYGTGIRLFSDREMCSVASGYSLFLRWDGTTSLG